MLPPSRTAAAPVVVVSDEPAADDNVETPPVPAGAVSPTGEVSFTPATVEELNELLPQYEFVELIGVGGMGAVYKARQPKLNRFVAIKMLPAIPDDELGFTERFEREAQAMASLSHPHIVAVYDFGETGDDQLFFVMEYVEGADLHQLITGGQLTSDHFFGWVPQICSAIQYAHDNGIVHRDIKPANILIDKEGRVKMADFGLAKLTGANEPQTALTLANLSMGTPDYAAPEQIDPGREVDWRADIYSLGVVMYQMLTGAVPRGAFPLPSESVGGLDRRVDDVVLKAMQSRPDDRYQAAGDISTKLTEILSAPEPVPEKTVAGKGGKRRHKSLFPAVAGLVGASVLLGLVLAVLNQKGKRKREEAEKARGTPAIVEQKPDKPPAGGGAEKGRDKPEPPVTKPDPPQEKPAIGSSGKGGKGKARQEEIRSKPDRPGNGRGGGGGFRPGNFADFKEKLGTRKRLEAVRRTSGNVVLLRWDGRDPGKSGLAAIPEDLGRVFALQIGQGPPQSGHEEVFAVALRSDGSVTAWGDHSGGPLEVPDAAKEGVVSVAAGVNHALALKNDGTVIAWGANDSGQCDVPAGLAGVNTIVAGLDFSIALKEDGTVAAWGSGAGAKAPADLKGVTEIAAGYDHVLALTESGAVISWGGNDFGQQKVPPIENAKAIAATFGGSYAMTGDGVLIGWGGWSKKEPIPKGQRVREIRGSGATLVARDTDGRIHLHGPGTRQSAMPAPLRQGAGDLQLEFGSEYVFIYRPVRLQEAGESVTVAEVAPPDLPEPEPPAPETEAGRRIAELQAKFEEVYLERVRQPFETSVGQLNTFYLENLEKRQTEAAAANELDSAVALRDESARFADDPVIPETDDSQLPDSLRVMRDTYRAEAAKFEEQRQANETELLGQYDVALESLQDEFTQAQKLDDALEVKEFREERAR